MTIPFMMNCSHQSDGWCLECLGEHYKEYESLRQQLADVIAERDRLRSRLEQLSQVLIDFTDRNADLCRELAMIEDERDRLRAELLQQPPTLEWLREMFGEPNDFDGKSLLWLSSVGEDAVRYFEPLKRVEILTQTNDRGRVWYPADNRSAVLAAMAAIDRAYPFNEIESDANQ